jgi:peptidoglycan L-alanyl-D-glutamate endopeptidase CwlK
MSDEHRERLTGVHPDLVAALDRILPVLAGMGHPLFVVEGVRSEARQAALWAKGRSEPGRVVTYCDGVTRRSRHQIDPATGFGAAADCAFQGSEPWGEAHPWEVYGALVRFYGLKWGGGFRLVDSPHAEMK